MGPIGPVPIVAGVAVFVVWVALAGTFDDPSLRSSVTHPSLRFVWFACRLLGAIVVIPIAEELAFRGYLARRLMDQDFSAVRYTDLSWPAIAISSVIFGVLHQGFIAGTAAGVCYALVARHRGRLSDAIVAHVVTSGLLAASAIVWQFR
jgi:CAAX prenyl protease-like protein